MCVCVLLKNRKEVLFGFAFVLLHRAKQPGICCEGSQVRSFTYAYV